MAEACDAAYLLERVRFEMDEGKRAKQPQIAWLHWDMARHYAALFMAAGGSDPQDQKNRSRPPSRRQRNH
jgi:hypothetical protein